jgi:hypothetical protein
MHFLSFTIASSASLTTLQKEEHEATIPKKKPNGVDDDVVEIPNPGEIPTLDDIMETSKPAVLEKSRRKRGRPRNIKNNTPNGGPNKVKEQFATATIARPVENKRKRFPPKQKTSPYKSP